MGHSLNIDFVNEANGAMERVAIEISADSALKLIEKIQAALEEGAKNHTLENAPAH